ncbi:MAG: hypothetical protein GX147_05515 [Deltaproteobacteria bacterium]|nr:hypothetical protein [Deltaproteobacteria bacterium]
MEYEKKLVPILREGIHIIKMFLYKTIRPGLAEKFADRDRIYINRLTGAVINEIFGTPNWEEPFLTFNRQNALIIEREISNLATDYPALKIPVTDALRVQFICDSQEGFENVRILSRANELHLLVLDRDFPLPDQFMNLARSLGEFSDITRQMPMGSA